MEIARLEKDNGEPVVPLAGIMNRREVRTEKVDGEVKEEKRELRMAGGEEREELRAVVPLSGIMDRGPRTRVRKDKVKGAQKEIARSTRSKAENRYMRKLRRMQEGTYRPSEQQREGAESEMDIAKSALKVIDAMEGPKVQKKKQKTKKEEGRKADAPTDSKTSKDTASNTRSNNPQPPKKKREDWQIQKSALSAKLSSQPWNPRKRVSPDTLSGIRALHASDPTTYTTPLLSQHFQISPDAVRRILKSKWQPSEQEVEKRMERWERRGVRKWEEMAAQGQKPPRKWREMGVENPVLKRKKWEAGKGREDRRRGRDEGVEGGGLAERIL